VWIDGQADMTKLTATLSSVANAPKNVPKDTSSYTGDRRVESEAAISENEIPSFCELIFTILDVCNFLSNRVSLFSFHPRTESLKFVRNNNGGMEEIA